MSLTEKTAKELIDALDNHAQSIDNFIGNYVHGVNINPEDQERIDKLMDALNNFKK